MTKPNDSNRAIVIVMDGCGAGEAPDAARFGDSDHPATLAHVWAAAGGIDAPHLVGAGLFAAAGVKQDVGGIPGFHCEYGRLRPLSEGKDSVTGHWEMMGIVTEVAFPTYPDGFPASLLADFEAAIGRKSLWGKPASGTEIIARLGDEHVKSGFPVVYTSADSVFQIACHESVVPPAELYRWCEMARQICTSPNNVERVIARPFEGSTGAYTRTGRRKDFPLTPPPNIVDKIVETTGQKVAGIGVVPELFAHRGFLDIPRTTCNAEHEVALLKAMGEEHRFIFANFEDFDMLYGHRNNPSGFADALVKFDATLANVMAQLSASDVLIITADHGNDPTSPSTDHSREYVPFVVIRPGGEQAAAVGDHDGMSRVGETVLNWLA